MRFYLRGHNWVHSAHGLQCIVKFKLRYLKNLKLFPIRVKELFELMVFALFKSIFLRNRSLSNARWFYGKKSRIGKGNLHLTENRLSRNEMWCAVGNHDYMSLICAKGLLDSNFNYAVIDKISNFQEIAPNFTFSQKS